MSRLACLHGFTGQPQAWNSVRSGLPADVDLLAPAILGHEGGPGQPASFVQEVDRLAAQLRRVAHHDWHLAGYSLGGRLALGLLVRHHHLFARATLIGAHPGLASEYERRQRRSADDALARRLEQRGLEPFVDFWQDLPLFHSQRSLPETVLRSQRAARLEHSPAGLARALRCLSLGAMPDFTPELADLDIPVQLLVGDLDPKFRRLAEGMVEVLPRASLVVVPSAGHNLLLEAPAAVASALRQALG